MRSETSLNITRMQNLKLQDIFIRDPFIVTDSDAGIYYLYGTNHSFENPVGFDVYRSRNLNDWEGPIPIFRPPDDFWADRNFWAPEVYCLGNRWIMSASFTKGKPIERRGTQLLQADHPEGPFCPIGEGPLTPHEDVCIDGTLYRAPDGNWWMIYAHERMQVTDGRMCAVPVDLENATMKGKPQVLFTGKDASWNAPVTHEGKPTWCAEGPFLHQCAEGTLIMLWAAFHEGFTYVQGQARSLSGLVEGPWEILENTLWENGGHGMLFRDLNGQLHYTAHAPGFSSDSKERAFVVPADDSTGTIKILTRR